MNIPDPSPASSAPRFHASELLRFGTTLFHAAGLADERARDVAEVLLEADLLGHDTHGFALMSPYLKAIEAGSMETAGEPEQVADHGSAVTWDGRYLPGPWLVRQAIAMARTRLNQYPTVTVVIRRGHHIGCLQSYLKPVTDAGFVLLLCCSDPASFVVAPFGGRVPRYSPNPIAVGIPTRGDPVLIDISTSSTAYGLCRRLADNGERLPGAWLLDAEGRVTNDPQVLFNHNGGTILPLGGEDLGYKGFALGLLVEALTSGLAGHGRSDHETRWGASVFLQLINPDAFGGRNAFLRETTFLTESCRTVLVPEGRPAVRLPGHAALKRRAEKLANGVPLHPSILPTLTPWAQKLGVPIPKATSSA